MGELLLQDYLVILTILIVVLIYSTLKGGK